MLEQQRSMLCASEKGENVEEEVVREEAEVEAEAEEASSHAAADRLRLEGEEMGLLADLVAVIEIASRCKQEERSIRMCLEAEDELVEDL